MDKKQLADELRKAFLSGTLADITGAIVKVLDAGYNWVAVYSDGFWANNAEWIYNARKGHGIAPSTVYVDHSTNLYQ